jgi:predicted amidohydrolase YtcJ
MAGINKDTVPPVGGVIVRDDLGEPTGILLNRATTLISDQVPKPSIETFTSYIKGGMLQMAKDGFVAVHQAGAEATHMQALENLQSNNDLPIRMYAMLSTRDKTLLKGWLKKGPQVDPTGFLDVRSVKAYYDGALGSRGARLLEGYSDQEGHKGVSGEGYGFDTKIVEQYIDAGFQLAIHAIGDAGNREVLEYFSKLGASNSKDMDRRHRVEHAQVIHPNDFKHFKHLNLIASMEPPHAVEDKTWAEDRLGEKRIKGAYAWRTLRLEGVPLTFNSDLPGSDHNIFYGIHAAITRKDKQSQPPEGWYPEQSVTIEEVIRGYTSWAAYAAFREQDTGLLKEGYWGDLTVMDIDPFELATTEPSQILKGKILLTMINGKIIYKK